MDYLGHETPNKSLLLVQQDTTRAECFRLFDSHSRSLIGLIMMNSQILGKHSNHNSYKAFLEYRGEPQLMPVTWCRLMHREVPVRAQGTGLPRSFQKDIQIWRMDFAQIDLQ